jgi:predicted Zn-dependent protease
MLMTKTNSMNWIGCGGKLWPAGLILAYTVLSGCVLDTAPSQPTGRVPEGRSASRSNGRISARETDRLRDVMIPLLRAMDHPCPLRDVQVGISSDSEINAGNAGNCQFLVTAGLLRKANDEELRGVMAHELAHQDLGHVARAQILGEGLNIGAALLQQFFPAGGALAPIAGTLIARGYGRTEEYEADRHGVDILRRAGYSKETMIEALSWVRRESGAGGGGFLSTHPALDERIAELKRLR